MPEMHFNDSSALTSVIYNGVDLDKVYYDNTLVFEKIKTRTDTFQFQYYASSYGYGTSFTFDKTRGYPLNATPKRVTGISGGLGNAKWSITGYLTGNVQMPADNTTASGTGSNYTILTWTISGTVITFTCSNWSTTGTTALTNVQITYEY